MKVRNWLVFISLNCFFCLFLSCSDDESSSSSTPAPTTPGRYNDLVFENVIRQNDITYGNNATQAGVSKDLKMDIYTPENDTESNRPVVLLAHGGSFTSGNKDQLTSLANYFAKSGYVAISINYRLLDVTQTPETSIRAVIDATHDMKAAVRYLKSNATSYKIDTESIFIGGYSAGAFMALNYGYLNDMTEAQAYGGQSLVTYLNANGGLEGQSGSSNFSSSIKGVLNVSGALGSASFVNAGEPILFSVHGTADTTVPFLSGNAAGTGVISEGSGLIHPIAENLGITNQLKKIEGGNHFAYLLSCTDCNELMRSFVFNNL